MRLRGSCCDALPLDSAGIGQKSYTVQYTVPRARLYVCAGQRRTSFPDLTAHQRAALARDGPTRPGMTLPVNAWRLLWKRWEEQER
jgi:hypothetical protein